MKLQPTLLLGAALCSFSMVACVPIEDPNYLSSNPRPRPPLRDGSYGAPSYPGDESAYGSPGDNAYQQGGYNQQPPSNYQQQGSYSQPRQQGLPQASGNANYPYATRSSGNPNYVVSPYPPHNTVDISGYLPNQIVKEPGTTRIFRVPNY